MTEPSFPRLPSPSPASRLALTLLAPLALLTACTPEAESGPTPLWQDEFTGAALNPAHWGYQTGNGFMNGSEYVSGWGNNELEYYTDRPENVRVEDGQLVITARKEAFTAPAGGTPQTFGWTSGRIRTAGKFSRTYGRFEIRAKFPTGKGLWPAIWMLPEDPSPYASWAANGEIDIAEGWGSKPTQVAHTLHYGGVWPNNTYSGVSAEVPGGVNDWHTYTLEWRPGEIVWKIDGQVTLTKTAWWSAAKNPPGSDADLNPWPAPFDRPFHLLLNLAVGGNFDGNPDATTPDTAEMRVDYVRVYGLEGETRDPGARPDMTYPWTPRPARPALPDGNLVYNPSFDWADTDPRVTPDATHLDGVPQSAFWTLFTLDSAVALSSDAAQGRALKADITAPGNVNYAVQVRQDGLNIEQGRRYEVSFDAWASTARAMMVKVGGGQDRGYAAYSGEQTVPLGTTRTRHTLTFDMKGTTDAAARLEFNLGGAGANAVWLDDVQVRAVGDAAGPRPPAPDGNLLYNAAFTQDVPGDPGIPGVPGTAYWATWEDGASGLSAAVQGGEIQLKVAHVNPANNWHVQLNQVNVPLTQDRTYTLTFQGRADTPRSVVVVVGENGGSYARYLNATADLTPTAQTFTYTFTAPVTNPSAQFQILGAVGAPGDAYTLGLRDFRLIPTP